MSIRSIALAGGVHPEQLLAAIQRCVIDETTAVLLVESGNSFAWANHLLRIPEPGRYRASMQWGSLGHASAGVLGAAVSASGKAVVLAGDGAMLFTNEVSTAVAHRLAAVWIVVNDAGYGSCVAGQRSRGLCARGLQIPRVDFASYARALGADGTRVQDPEALVPALSGAMTAEGPYVVDVLVRRVDSPLATRFSSFFAVDAKGHDR
jgi:acetolactate synthase-1/2/3 large subunit